MKRKPLTDCTNTNSHRVEKKKRRTENLKSSLVNKSDDGLKELTPTDDTLAEDMKLRIEDVERQLKAKGEENKEIETRLAEEIKQHLAFRAHVNEFENMKSNLKKVANNIIKARYAQI